MNDQELNNLKKNQPKALKWIQKILMFLGIIFLLNIILSIIFIFSKSPLEINLDSREFVRKVVRDGNPESVIVMIHLSGVIGMESDGSRTAGNDFSDKLGLLEYEKALKAVIIVIDSPGGSATDSDILYSRLRKMDIPKVALLGNIAASGGYYVASACNEIIAHPTSLTGSIGVIIQYPEISGLLENIGVDILTIKSGPHKDMLSPYREPELSEIEMLQSAVDEIYYRFLESVAAGRNMEVDEVRKIADGSVFSAKTALGYGLIDSIGYEEDAIKRAEILGGAADCLVVTYTRKQSLLDVMGVKQQESIPELSAIRNLIEAKGPLFLYTY